MKRVIVTGGGGKLGRACVQDLLDHGYSPFVVDQNRPNPRLCPGITADLTDYGQTIDALSASDGPSHEVHAVVHLAAIPAPRIHPNAFTFRNNTLGDYNVFEACRRL